jgi:predicted ester cyclase
MSVEENKKTLQRYFDEIMNDGDYLKAHEIIHENFEGAASGGFKGKGIEAHKQYRKLMFTTVPDAHWETLEMIAEGNKVVLFNEFKGTLKGEFLGIPPTNKQFTRVIAGVYEFEDGKIIRGLTRVVSDGLSLFQQLGVLPSTEEIVKTYKESHNLA